MGLFKRFINPYIVYKINDQIFTFNKINPFNIEENLKNARIEVFIRKHKEKDIELGNISFIKEGDIVPQYIISVNTVPYFWQMGIATLVISFAILLFMQQNDKNDFVVYAQLQKEAKRIWIEKKIFVYRNIFEETPSVENEFQVTRLFKKCNRVADEEKFASQVRKKEDYLIKQYEQIQYRNYNDEFLYKVKDEI